MFRRIASLFLWATASVSAATLSPIQLLNPAGSTAGQAVVSTGPSTAPAWGTVTAGALSPVAANTVIGNFTAASASPTARAVPSCSTANSALQFTTSTGLSCGTSFALTTGNLSQFAATTSSQLAGVLSDETGTGSAVFSVSPTFTGTVNAAAITATGAITPSQTAGIVGTTTNNNANAGSVGEYVTNSATGVAITSSTLTNVTSISLSAGDWDVSGVVNAAAAGTTTITSIFAAVNTTSATLPADNMYQAVVNNTSAGFNASLMAPVRRISLSSTTTVFLVAAINYQVSTLTVGGTIRARRVR